jgi:16S rRNA (guanine527-N7)-methyltransferase
VTSAEFRDRLASRTRNAGVLVSADVQSRLETYFRLLSKWNAKVNLTALPLHRPTNETFDRLLVEPLVAGRYMPGSVEAWLDVGSGGGSPAIPLKIARPSPRLILVESRSRKAAFLREAVRALDLHDTVVENQRMERAATRVSTHSVDLVTLRAVRLDRSLLDAIHQVLSPAGQTFFFHSPRRNFTDLHGFAIVRTVLLSSSGDSMLSILAPMFHVEQNG